MNVSIFNFAFQYMKSDFYDTVKYFQNHETKSKILNITYPTGQTAFMILKDKDIIEKVLKSNAKLGYHYSIFTQIIGHKYNFTNPDLNPDISLGIHNAFHKSIISSISGSRLQDLIKKHINVLFKDDSFILNRDKSNGAQSATTFEDLMIRVWSEYVFGEDVDVDKYIELRSLILDYLKIFYDSKYKFVPIIGNLTTKMLVLYNKQKLSIINDKLKKLVNNSLYRDKSKEILIVSLFNNLMEEMGSNPSLVHDIILDNTFIFVLVYDFLANVLHKQFENVVLNNIDSTEERKSQYNAALNESFLFQYRSRVLEEDTHGIKKGTLVYIDLKESELYHSLGPRGCLGISFTNIFKNTFWNLLENYNFRISCTHKNNEQISRDMPVSQYQYQISWHYKRNCISKLLPSFEHKGLSKFYHVLNIYENPELTKYVIRQFTDILALKCTENTCIVAPELRGIPIASYLAFTLNIPLFIIRKAGKTPGPVFTINYNTAYSSDTFEISQNSQLNYKNIIFVDDGISSGGTLMACCNLIKDNFTETKIISILCILNHLKEKVPEFKKYENITHTLFDL